MTSRGTTRRGFLCRSGGAAAALGAARPLAAAAAAQASGKALFAHGVASGDPLADRVIPWARVTPASPRATVAVRWEVATDPALGRVVARGVDTTDAKRDFTAKVGATGLRPATSN